MHHSDHSSDNLENSDDPTSSKKCIPSQICLVCGNVGCGRYTAEHAQHHYLETTHNFAMALSDSRVWDYAGDYFVHRLVTNESSGKMIETKSDEKKSEEFELSVQMECLQ